MLGQMEGANSEDNFIPRNDTFIQKLAEENRSFIIRFALDGLFKHLLKKTFSKPQLVKKYLRDYHNFMENDKKTEDRDFFSSSVFLQLFEKNSRKHSGYRKKEEIYKAYLQ